MRGQNVQVLAGTGSNSTAGTIELSLWAEEQGADGLLIVTPYYNKPSQAGLIAHYGAIADEVEIPIMLYNVPGRTGVSLASASVAALAKHPKITAIKEASGSVSFASEIIDAVGREGRTPATGDDAVFAYTGDRWLRRCLRGDNLFPRACVQSEAFDVGHEATTEIHQFSPLFGDLSNLICSHPITMATRMVR